MQEEYIDLYVVHIVFDAVLNQIHQKQNYRCVIMWPYEMESSVQDTSII